MLQARHERVPRLGRTQGEENEVLLVHGADAKVRNSDGRMGDFYIEFLDGQPRWVYYDLRINHGWF